MNATFAIGDVMLVAIYYYYYYKISVFIGIDLFMF